MDVETTIAVNGEAVDLKTLSARRIIKAANAMEMMPQYDYSVAQIFLNTLKWLKAERCDVHGRWYLPGNLELIPIPEFPSSDDYDDNTDNE